MKEKWLPIFLGNPQSATPYMIYEYYNDDTLKKVTDPRLASSTQVYNSRHLVTSVTYGVPSGVAATPNVTFGYDEAGNRTLMDDGPGTVTYNYDSLSRLASETRVFANISKFHYQGSGQPYQNTFSIDYQYNLTDGLKQIQTPTGDNIDYTLDKAGMTAKVSGTPRDGVTDYITDIKYRAWGAAKRVSYGYANYSIDAQFNERMLISSIDDQSQLGVTYNYNHDGRVNTVQGIHTRTLDRSFNYDHVSRVLQTRSGSQAGLGGAEPSQLSQDYAHNAFNHMTSRSGSYWYTGNTTFSATYINDRATGVTDNGAAQNWQYDVAGNVKSYLNNSVNWIESFDKDAAGRTAVKSWLYTDTGNLALFRDFGYDGDGNLVSEGEVGSLDGSIAKYHVRSTVLSKSLLNISIAWGIIGSQYVIGQDILIGGQVRDLTERNLSIYAGGEEIATRTYEAISLPESNKVIWQHRDPHNTIARIGNASDHPLYSVDPLNVLVKTATQSEMDAYWNPPGGGDPTPAEGFYSDQSGQNSSYGFGSPFPGNWGIGCYVDKIQVPCERAFRFLANGSGKIDEVNTPTGSVQVPGLTIREKFSSHSTDRPDKWVDGKYVGGGNIVGSTEYEVEMSSLFTWQTQPPPWTVKNNVPVVRDMVYGFKNAAHILTGNDAVAKSCRNALASTSNPDPLAILIALYGNGPDYRPDEIKNGTDPDPWAMTEGIGKNAKLTIYARYWSAGGLTPREGADIIVGGKRVHLKLYQAQVLVWLHETSHGTGKYTHRNDSRYDRPNVGENELNEIIYNNCLKGAKLLPEPPPPKNCPVCK